MMCIFILISDLELKLCCQRRTLLLNFTFIIAMLDRRKRRNLCNEPLFLEILCAHFTNRKREINLHRALTPSINPPCVVPCGSRQANRHWTIFRGKSVRPTGSQNLCNPRTYPQPPEKCPAQIWIFDLQQFY
jgi:hypothetical protein